MDSTKAILRELNRHRPLADRLEDLVVECVSTGITMSEVLTQAKRRYIVRVLEKWNGNQCRAARELNMHRNTLSRTLAVLKITSQAYKRPPMRIQRAQQEKATA